jgi:hypothetical protein
MGWTLADIRRKVRQITGRFDTEEITNTQLDTYINNYYVYTFPAELKLNEKLTFYEFLTEENTQSYPAPTGYTNFVPPATVDNLSLTWYQNPAAFLNNNPLQVQKSIAWTGDGVTTAFNTTAQSFPVLPGSLIITDNVEVFEDTNTAWSTTTQNITGSLGGTATINYATGAITVSFSTAPVNGDSIWLSYTQFQPGRPISVLYFNNEFSFYPLPDTAYRFKVQAYQIVAPLVNATDTPDLQQWGPCIAYGASRDIHSDFGEMESYAQVTSLYKEQLAYVLRRTNQDLLNIRAQPQF